MTLRPLRRQSLQTFVIRVDQVAFYVWRQVKSIKAPYVLIKRELEILVLAGIDRARKPIKRRPVDGKQPRRVVLDRSRRITGRRRALERFRAFSDQPRDDVLNTGRTPGCDLCQAGAVPGCRDHDAGWICLKSVLEALTGREYHCRGRRLGGGGHLWCVVSLGHPSGKVTKGSQAHAETTRATGKIDQSHSTDRGAAPEQSVALHCHNATHGVVNDGTGRGWIFELFDPERRTGVDSNPRADRDPSGNRSAPTANSRHLSRGVVLIESPFSGSNNPVRLPVF